MKKILLLLLLFFNTIISQSQTVNIPDVNFKNKLLSSLPSNTVAGNLALTFFKIDSNSDNEIQVSEALQVGYIDISNSNIVDLTGLEQFVNLKTLICNNNQISNLNLSVFVSLEKLTCNNNLLTNVDINGLVNLEQFNCKNNLLTTLNASNFNNLFLLDCSYNQISNLNISGLINLSFLNCQGNQLTNINLLGLTDLEFIYCGGNQFTNLDLSGLSNLKELYCNSNLLSTLNLNGFNNLSKLDVSNNLFSSINVLGLSSLQRLVCNSNFLTDLNLSGLINLQFLNCRNNQLQTLDVNEQINLQQIFCYDNLLTSLYVKNGVNESIFSFYNNPNLQFICADDVQINSIQNQLTSLGMTATVSNTYCSFTPGGDHNTITGVTQFDINNNGCDINDIQVQYFGVGVNLNGVSTNSSVYTNSLGNYSLFTSQIGTYGLTPNLENPTYFNVNPNPASVNISAIDNSTTTQNFCITANGVHPDLEIVIAPIVPARPGFDAVYKIVYRNKGNTTLSQQYGINFFYDENVLDFVSTTFATSSVGSGSLSWDYANLKPFENRSFYVTLNVNSPTETPAVNIGDVLTLTASILPSAGDENTFDNLFQFNQTVVGSYDPNDITCIQGGVVAPSYIGQYLHYVINFENTGTYQAENIVVKTQINPADFDIATLRLMEASHNVATRINGNIIEFVFQTINLDTGGHGNILLKIKTNGNLQTSDIVTNKADIYFDYNFPIQTNFANTTFQVLSNSIITIDNSVGVYPNPVNDMVNIKANTAISSIEIYDVQGRIVHKKITNQKTESIDVSAYSNGIYFLKIKTQVGEKVEKIVKK
ncbi:MAG: Leucine-rich repeat (LRR) protein [Flavobacterium sp.]|jgi:Leucine-rich repeat (LRR) protein